MSTHQRLIEQIQNAKLAFHDVPTALAASANDKAEVTGTNNAGASGNFAAALVNLSPLNQNDVLESLLYAQARANYETKGPFSDPTKWYKVFVTELGNIFWANIELGFAEASISSLTVVSDLVIIYLKSIGAEKSAGRLIDTLKNLPPPARPREIFNEFAAKGKVSVFGLATAEYVGKNIQLGIVIKQFMSLVFVTDGSTMHQPAELSTLVNITTTEITITDVLSTSVSQTEANFFQSRFESILDVGMYAGIRQAIKDALKQAAL
ncbi:hypothetical protein FRC07_000936, partial [Ceratobasidium sp. 392]